MSAASGPELGDEEEVRGAFERDVQIPAEEVSGQVIRHGHIRLSEGHASAELKIDHIDGVRSNNKITNLRDVTPAENMKNVSMRSDNTSGVTGVLYRQDIGKWQAGIGVSGEHKHLGVYVRKEDAVAARIDAECRYGFSERHGTPS